MFAVVLELVDCVFVTWWWGVVIWWWGVVIWWLGSVFRGLGSMLLGLVMLLVECCGFVVGFGWWVSGFWGRLLRGLL